MNKVWSLNCIIISYPDFQMCRGLPVDGPRPHVTEAKAEEYQGRRVVTLKEMDE